MNVQINIIYQQFYENVTNKRYIFFQVQGSILLHKRCNGEGSSSWTWRECGC